jgi:pantothenate kinase type III
MLLVIDVGNTNTVLGVFARIAKVHPGTDETGNGARYERLVAHWRVATALDHTVDEYGVLFRSLFAMDDLDVSGIHGIVISSVVPPLDSNLRQVCERYFKLKPLFIEPGVKTGMPVQYENPAEVGADRIVNGVAAFEKYGGPCVVVDFGTATTFDCVSAKGEYLGGVICPGIGAVLRISRPGRWHPGGTSQGDGKRFSGSRDRRTGSADRDGVEIHQADRRVSDARRAAHHLGTKCRREIRQANQARGRNDKTPASLLPLSTRGKLLQLLHRD